MAYLSSNRMVDALSCPDPRHSGGGAGVGENPGSSTQPASPTQ